MELRQVELNGVRDYVIVDPKVFVDNKIAKAHDYRPFNMRIKFLKIFEYLCHFSCCSPPARKNQIILILKLDISFPAPVL